MSATETQQAVPTGTWHADPVHSDIGFSIDYMAGTFRGTFSEFTAELTESRLRGSAEVASVHVKDENLVEHLQSPDFFDAERNPQLLFSSREVSRSGDDGTIDGEITIKGRTAPVELRGTITDAISDPFGNERFGLRIQARLDRTSFGLDWNNPLPTGEPALANDVKLDADIQFVKAA
ncbi:YceI family protein [soil metagenome]